MTSWTFDGPYGEIEFTWSDNQWDTPPAGETARVALLSVQEPYRESYGHSAWITSVAARDLAERLVAFADWEDANPPAPRFKPSI